MGEDNIWLAGRHQEGDALGRIILTLNNTRLADGTVQAIRGAGVQARTEAITGKGQQLMRGNPDNLRQAAARKSAAAQDPSRARTARDRPPQRADHLPRTGPDRRCLLGFLYRCTPIRQRVQQLRAQQQNTPPPAAATPTGDETPSSVVRTLTAQLTELKRRHRDEISALKQALEAAHGENLELRRRLGAQRALDNTKTP
jgi:hypothetical protein